MEPKTSKSDSSKLVDSMGRVNNPFGVAIAGAF